jgi:anti-anti-sigma regulatory factor
MAWDDLKSILINLVVEKDNVAIHLKSATYFDSSTVIVLLAAAQRLKFYKKHLYVITSSEQVKEMFVKMDKNHEVLIVNGGLVAFTAYDVRTKIWFFLSLLK